MALQSNRYSTSQSRNSDVNLRLHRKQGFALLTPSTETAYGGAAGGGKSHLGRVAAITWAYRIPGLQVYLFRRTHNELEKNHFQGPTSFPAMLAPWAKAGFVRIVKNEIRFKNGPSGGFEGGSRIFACHCQHEKDVFNWLGPEMHFLIIEQAEQFTPFMITMLRGRNRIPDTLNIPKEYKELFPRCLYTFNPGGVEHVFFKSKFYKPLKRDLNGVSEIVQADDSEGGKRRQFIQAKLEDNPSVNPVEYRRTLSGLPPKMREALLEGNMDAVIGAFFPQVSRELHLVKAFKIPGFWPRFMAYDHGACGDGDPFSIGWYTVADGSTSAQIVDTGRIFQIPRNSLICYRRWNGSGLPKQNYLDIANGIKSREKDEEILFRTAGGDILEQRGHGESIFGLFANEGLRFIRADMRRLNGWEQVNYRLDGRDETPLSFWFEECEEDLETIGALQHDMTDINDTAPGDDHDADRHRYACMTRPLAEKPPPEPQSIVSNPIEELTPKKIIKQIKRQNHARSKRRY